MRYITDLHCTADKSVRHQLLVTKWLKPEVKAKAIEKISLDVENLTQQMIAFFSGFVFRHSKHLHLEKKQRKTPQLIA